MKKRGSKHKLVMLAIIAGVGLFWTPAVRSHCEIPCGIYDDPMRIALMAEHIRTIEKSIKQIHALSAAAEKDYNQLTRWVVNKGDHADWLSDIVTQYFLKQRVTPAGQDDAAAYETYVRQLTLLHRMMVASMKCKQTTDLDHVEQLRRDLKEFEKAYFGEAKAAHAADHHHPHD